MKSSDDDLSLFQRFRGGPGSFFTLLSLQARQWECGGVILARPCWECALREFLEGFTAGMAMLGAMLVLTALADKLL